MIKDPNVIKHSRLFWNKLYINIEYFCILGSLIVGEAKENEIHFLPSKDS